MLFNLKVYLCEVSPNLAADDVRTMCRQHKNEKSHETWVCTTCGWHMSSAGHPQVVCIPSEQHVCVLNRYSWCSELFTLNSIPAELLATLPLGMCRLETSFQFPYNLVFSFWILFLACVAELLTEFRSAVRVARSSFYYEDLCLFVGSGTITISSVIFLVLILLS